MTGTVILMEGNDSFPVVDPAAIVTVNGEALEPFFGYSSTTLTPVAFGSNVTLHLAYDTIDVTQSLPMPEGPANVATVGSGYLDPANDITITWNLMAPQPDEISVIVWDTVSGEAYEGSEAGNSTSHTIPGGTLLASHIVMVSVSSSNTVTALKNGELSLFTYSVSNVAEVTIDTNPP